jgi:hypothetical protein
MPFLVLDGEGLFIYAVNVYRRDYDRAGKSEYGAVIAEDI